VLTHESRQRPLWLIRNRSAKKMRESLHQLISGRGFDAFRPGLESRFRANRLVYSIRYGEPPSLSLLVRRESADRMGEVCAWESGDCEVQLATVAQDDIDTRNYCLESDSDFHRRLAEVFRFVAKRELTAE
jgi:hypothetical protein